MNRLKIQVFLLLFSFSILSTWAKKVEISQAVTVAQTQVSNQYSLRSSGKPELKLVHTAKPDSNNSLRSEDQTVYYYVFNVGEDQGYVIISGDDSYSPIIAYSTSGSYDTNNTSPAFSVWMDDVSKTMDKAISENKETSEKVKSEWEAFLNGNINTLRSTTAIAPLIQTQWDQSSPYNDLCPLYGGQKTVTGCVATVMAQIMNYHKCPSSLGTCQSPAYVSKTYGHNIPAINHASNSFDWNNMATTYKTADNRTQAQKDAVAKLMYHCGASVKMDYATSAQGGSGSSLVSASLAFMEYFKYDYRSLEIKSKFIIIGGMPIDYIDNSTWKGYLIAEINTWRPVFYSGSSVQGGHAFICDGYDDMGLFHFNWGWGGANDGYFNIESIAYPSYNQIGIGIKPLTGTPAVATLNVYVHTSNPNPNPVPFSVDKNSVKVGDTVRISSSFLNPATSNPFGGYYGYALLNASNNQIVKILFQDYFFSPLFPISTYTTYQSVPCAIEGVDPGNYKIRTVSKPFGKENWSLIDKVKNSSYVDVLSLEVKSNTGIESHKTNNIYHLYPNPVETELYINQSSGDPIQSIQIYDLYGKLVNKMTIDSDKELITVPVGDLNAGVYVISMKTASGSFSQKVLKR